jgi:predicted DNA-binding helix-hairpin-helix protein
MSTTGPDNTATPAVDDKVRTALSSRWESAVPVEFDGSNYPAWKESIVRVFTLRRAQWFLEARERNDDELNAIALSILTSSLSAPVKYLLDSQTSFPVAYK